MGYIPFALDSASDPRSVCAFLVALPSGDGPNITIEQELRGR